MSEELRKRTIYRPKAALACLIALVLIAFLALIPFLKSRQPKPEPDVVFVTIGKSGFLITATDLAIAKMSGVKNPRNTSYNSELMAASYRGKQVWALEKGVRTAGKTTRGNCFLPLYFTKRNQLLVSPTEAFPAPWQDLLLYDVRSRNTNTNDVYPNYRGIGDTRSLDNPNLRIFQTSNYSSSNSARQLAILDTENGKFESVIISDLIVKQNTGFELRSVSSFGDYMFILLTSPSLQSYSTSTVHGMVDNTFIIYHVSSGEYQVTTVERLKDNEGNSLSDVLKREFKLPEDTKLYYSTFKVIRPPNSKGGAIIAVDFSYPRKDGIRGAEYRSRIIEGNPITGEVIRWDLGTDCEDKRFNSSEDIYYQNSLYNEIMDLTYVFVTNHGSMEVRTSYIYAVDKSNNWQYVDKTRISYFNSTIDKNGRLWYLKCDGKPNYAPTAVCCFDPIEGKGVAVYEVEAETEINRLLANP